MRGRKLWQCHDVIMLVRMHLMPREGTETNAVCDINKIHNRMHLMPREGTETDNPKYLVLYKSNASYAPWGTETIPEAGKRAAKTNASYAP